MHVMNMTGTTINAGIELNVSSQNAKAEKIKPLSQKL